MYDTGSFRAEHLSGGNRGQAQQYALRVRICRHKRTDIGEFSQQVPLKS